LNSLKEGGLAPTLYQSMASSSISDFSSPSVAHVTIGPRVEVEDVDFEIKPSLITMVQASTFSGKPHEDANAHLQHFLEVCSTIAIRGVTADAIRLRLFPFSLFGKAKQWFYAQPDDVNTWRRCANAFLKKFFPMGKTSALRAKISSFQQKADETIPEAWERLQEYIQECPHHGIKEWLLIQGFYHGLTPVARSHLDAAARGAFTSLNVTQAKTLIENIVTNQTWREERPQLKKRSTKTIEEVNEISHKMEFLLKKLDERAKVKKDREAIQQYATARANQRSRVQNASHEAVQSFNNGRPTSRFQGQGNSSNSNWLSLKELVINQAKINESMNKRLLANDKTLESLTAKMDSLVSSVKDQLNFNKILESQIAQIAATVPSSVNSCNIFNVTTRGGKTTRDPPYPDMTKKTARKDKEVEEDKEEAPSKQENTKFYGKTAPHEFYDTNILLPFPRTRKPTTDEQFGKFVEVIRQLYVNIPLLDAMQVPTYAKYLRDILNNKRPLPTTEVIKLTEECSAAILNQLPEKKKDPGCPTIDCSIGTHHFEHALCDLGASVSVMPKVIFDKLTHAVLSPTSIHLQLADQSIRHPAGVAENIPVKIREFLVPVDFVVLDMEVDEKTPLILGRPFLSTANAHIDVGAGEIQFTINGAQEKFNFKPKVVQCSLILAVDVATVTFITRPKKKTNPTPRAKSKKIWKKKVIQPMTPPKKISVSTQGGGPVLRT